MDTLSHALIGMAVAGLSGHPPSFTDPIYIATIVGAQAPDFDIIAQLQGRLAYIKHHRSFSHSLLGLVIWSTLIACGIHFFIPQAPLLATFGWAYAGGLSHSIIDYFNTHGAAVLWPFYKDRKSMHLLNVFDPVLLTLLLSLFLLDLTPPGLSYAIFAVIMLYLCLRFYLRQRATQWLINAFATHSIQRCLVMPSLKRIFFWDFIIETDSRYFVGQIGALHPLLEIRANLPRHNQISTITAEAQRTLLGNFFNRFTPFIYFEEQLGIDSFKVNIYDLRYLVNKQFLHRATIIFDEANVPATCYMHSYGHKIEFPC